MFGEMLKTYRNHAKQRSNTGVEVFGTSSALRYYLLGDIMWKTYRNHAKKSGNTGEGVMVTHLVCDATYLEK